jgi:hypothetical protein
MAADQRPPRRRHAEAPGALSQATTIMRSKVRRRERFDEGDFLEGRKSAEEHRRRTEG